MALTGVARDVYLFCIDSPVREFEEFRKYCSSRFQYYNDGNLPSSIARYVRIICNDPQKYALLWEVVRDLPPYERAIIRSRYIDRLCGNAEEWDMPDAAKSVIDQLGIPATDAYWKLIEAVSDPRKDPITSFSPSNTITDMVAFAIALHGLKVDHTTLGHVIRYVLHNIADELAQNWMGR